MRICAIQIRPVAGAVDANIVRHVTLAEHAVGRGAELVFFPELSLTGYEPRLAGALATTPDDRRLDVFQRLSDAHDVVLGVGLPLSAPAGVQIGMVFFRPAASPRAYCKRMLHADELPYFIPGEEPVLLETGGHLLAPAICYESLQPAHAAEAAERHTDIYLASVAKSANGTARAFVHYPEIARRHAMIVVMANCVGPCDDFLAVGQSAAWNRRGERLAELDSESEGIVMVDTTMETAHAFVADGAPAN